MALAGRIAMHKELCSRLVDATNEVGERRLLEMVARGHPLRRVLDELCRVVEELLADCWCGVVLVDPSGTRLERAAAPSLPDSFLVAINGRPLYGDSGPNAM